MEVKYCEICGGEIENPKSNSKYCQKCRRNPEKYRAMSEIGYRKIAKLDEPKLQKVNCSNCGKQFTIIENVRRGMYGWVDKGVQYLFCSSKCKDTFKRSHIMCLYCGKSLKDSKYYDPRLGSRKQFCNKECHEKYKEKTTPKKQARFCVYCGKQITSGNLKFCNNACKDAALKNGYQYDKKKPFVYEATCEICGKPVVKHSYKQIPDFNKWNHYCSKACEKIGKEKIRRENQIIRAKEKLEKALKIEKEENQEPLCLSCRTNYKQCERMKSDFQKLPIGAKVNKKGEVIICPKYKA